jgi:ribonuclease J
MRKEDTFIMEIGQVLEINTRGAKIGGDVPAGRVLVDGLGVGDIGSVVLRDRKHLAEDGLIIVIVTAKKETGSLAADPDIISRGFVYVKESEAFMEELKQVCIKAVKKCKGKNWSAKKSAIKESLRDHIYKKTKRNPMILPFIIDV